MGKNEKKIYKYISKNYKDKFNYFDDDYILGLFSDEKEFCHLDKNNVYSSEDNNEINITDNFSKKHEKTKNNVHSSEDNNEINITDNSSEKHEKTKNDNNYSSIFKITFLMKDKGYSYQYNDYQRSGTKLQKRANQFVLITLIYYIFSWLVKDPLSTFKILLEKILKIIFHIKIDFEVIPTILFTIFLLGIIRKIFDNK